MKRYPTLVLFTTLITFTLSAQQDSVEACGYYGDNAKFSRNDLCKYHGFTSNAEAEEKIELIMSQMGLKMNFLVVECPNIRNAFAVNHMDNTGLGLLRYIIYDNAFMNEVDLKSNTNWAAVSILAHEIGHHLNGHTLDGKGSRPPKELEADEFSGFAMYKLGATLEQSQAAMANYASNRTSRTHPAKADRLEAIRRGWENAESLTPKYEEKSRNADYTSIAKKWFMKAYNIEGNTEQDYINRVAYYGKATEYRADYVVAYRNRAKNLNVLGLHSKALQDANRAISLDKEHWNAYSEKATAYVGLRKYQEAIDTYTVAIVGRKKPSPFDVAGRGWAYYKMGEKEKAKKDLERALKYKPNWPSVEQKLKIVSN